MNLPPVLTFQWTNSNGPLSGGQLYSYAAGTTTPQPTYTDQTGATPNTNPVVLDSNGSAPVWLDPTLSYKFVLLDAGGATIWTRDQVVGVLTPNSVNTASLQNGAVTSAKMAANSVTSTILQSDASIDANRAVGSDHIKTSAVTRPKLGSGIYLAPGIQTLTSGTAATYGLTYVFFLSSANATAGSTYVNNSITYTVERTISGGAFLYAWGSGAPLPSGTLTRSSGTGDATITYTSVVAPLYLRIRMVGGGGGGAGSGVGAAFGNGGNGGNTTFGTSFLIAGGGGGGTGGYNVGTGGVGGTATVNAGAYGIGVVGSSGAGVFASANSGTGCAGGLGGASPFGGAGLSNYSSPSTGGAAATNSGSGGAGGATTGFTSETSGSGGGAGGYIDVIVPGPQASYTYTIGAAGTAGAAGTSGFTGGAGGSGIIIVEECYQ